MVDVDVNNFQQILIDLRTLIPESDFVAIDMEFTGLEEAPCRSGDPPENPFSLLRTCHLIHRPKSLPRPDSGPDSVVPAGPSASPRRRGRRTASSRRTGRACPLTRNSSPSTIVSERRPASSLSRCFPTRQQPPLPLAPAVSLDLRAGRPSQVGICPFSWDEEEGGFVAHPYNFYTLPKTFRGQDRRFLCQTRCMNFLAASDFDFNKLFRSGIPFMNADQVQVQS